jgi:AraC family transcriptional regulator
MKRRTAGTNTNRRDQLVDAIGTEVVRFQEESSAFDDVAARVLAVERGDLPCMTVLLFGGPLTIDHLAAALDQRGRAVAATIDRLQLAGYVRQQHGGNGSTIELTEHAREWIERIWAPLRDDGARLLGSYSARHLALVHTFMRRARHIQERQVGQLRKWLELPAAPHKQAHLRGGLSPAALRRVQVFVEANLARTIHLKDLAQRAGLSLAHFARAFRASAGTTPRAFIEERRIDLAKRLITESDQSLAEIAVAAGFGTQSRLTTTFRRHTRFTPGQYRRAR